MKIAPPRDCAKAIRDAAGQPLSDDEVLQIAEAIQARRRALAAEGRLDGIDRRLRQYAQELGQQARIAAALQRRHVMLNALVRDRLDATIDGHLQAGLDYVGAALAVLEGSVRGVPGARVSVAATRLAFERKFVGEMTAALSRELPHLRQVLDDPALMDDAVREMWTPGSTSNAQAQTIARIFRQFSEVSRTELNRLGANIGRLDGWAGPQQHDAWKMVRVDRDEWVRRVMPRLDLARTMPDVVDPGEFGRILGDIYDTIVSGRDRTVTARERGQHAGPANLARSLERHRVLHFKSADDWLAYRDEFGRGSLLAAMMTHQRQAARLAAHMQVLGPNPEVMMASKLAELQRRVRSDPAIAPERKADIVKALQTEAGPIGNAMAEMLGATSSPVHLRAATIGNALRIHQSMAKLGGAVISALGGDVVTTAANLRFNGVPLWRAYRDTVREFLAGRGAAERREVAFLVGEGFDGLIDHIISADFANDAMPGMMARAQATFFRWSGLSWETDAMRAAGARIYAAYLGSNLDRGWQALPAELRHTFGLHGIGAAQWEAIRQGAFLTIDGRRYVTPDRVADLPDWAVRPLAQERIAALRNPSQRAIDTILADTRRDLEMAISRYLSDEISFGHIETDEASRRWTLHGSRPGTFGGEAWRFVMQFKGFPIAFTRRVLGRAVYGQRGATRGERLLHGAGHIGHLIAGYMAMTAKDLLRNWEPRQPDDAEDWAKLVAAAMVQSGGAGIYGDFLFGEYNRFGAGPAETLAGPTLGAGGQAIVLWSKLRTGDAKAADAFNLLLQNAPFVNLWYTRPALDYLVLNALHEAASPGYLRRQERRRRREYGQDSIIPRSAW